MTQFRRPRAFISYRHQERSGSAEAGAYSRQHREWVERFASALATWNVDVIYDGHLRRMFKPYCFRDPGMVPFVGEVSLLCLHVAQAFMPVLTRGYLERIGGAEPQGALQYGAVTEEWQFGKSAAAAGKVECVAIVREWPIRGYAAPPEPVGATAWDFRYVFPDRDEVEVLADNLHGNWTVARPPFDMPFKEWIQFYIRWLLAMEPSLQWPLIENWNSDYNRPKLFLRHCEQMAKDGAFPSAEEGSGRNDMDHFLATTGQSIPKVEASGQLDAASQRSLDAQAEALAKSVFAAHVQTFRRPVDFSDGRVAQDGLYFGPTVEACTYLHPMDKEGRQSRWPKAAAAPDRPNLLSRLFGRRS